MFYETAQDLIYRHIPEPGDDELRQAFRAAQDEYLRQGITTSHDAYVSAPILEAYRRAQREDNLRLRVNMFLGWELLQDAGFELRTGDVDGRLRVAGCKLISDGSIQGITAALREPYHCDNAESGWLIYEQDELNEIVKTLHGHDYQVIAHANGDAAIDSVLDAYENALGPQPVEDHRYRIEHCQVCHPGQLRRMAALGVIPDFFANHVYYWGDRHRDRFLGPERVLNLDPVGSAYQQGLRPLLHSDCPVTPVSPLFNVQCAAVQGHQLRRGPQPARTRDRRTGPPCDDRQRRVRRLRRELEGNPGGRQARRSRHPRPGSVRCSPVTDRLNRCRRDDHRRQDRVHIRLDHYLIRYGQ